MVKRTLEWRAQGRSRDGIAREALAARAVLCPDLGANAPFPANLELFERVLPTLTILDRQVDYEVIADAMGVEAQTRFEHQSGRFICALSETTYCALEAQVPRARFTLCHELGHLFMHPHEAIARSRFGLARLMPSSQSHPVYMDGEWQADEFASMLLIPTAALLLTVEAITEQYVVSYEAAVSRLRGAGMRK